MRKSVFVDSENQLATDRNSYSSMDNLTENHVTNVAKRRVFGDLGNKAAAPFQSSGMLNQKQPLSQLDTTKKSFITSSRSGGPALAHSSKYSDRIQSKETPIEREYMKPYEDELDINAEYTKLYSKKYPTLYEMCNKPGTYEKIMHNMIGTRSASTSISSKSGRGKEPHYVDEEEVQLPRVVRRMAGYHDPCDTCSDDSDDDKPVDYLSMFNFDSD